MRTAGVKKERAEAVEIARHKRVDAEQARPRKDGTGIQAILPPTLLELKGVIKKYLRLESARIFLEGKREIVTDHDYNMLEPGDTIVVVDNRGKRIDMADTLRRASMDGDFQSSRLVLPPEQKKLIHFTNSTETRDHYVDHTKETGPIHSDIVVDAHRTRNVIGSSDPKDGWLSRIEPGYYVRDGRPHSPTRNEQIAMTEGKKIPADSPWWKSAKFTATSEAADQFRGGERTEIIDTRETTLRNLRSDFHLFAHNSGTDKAHRTYASNVSEHHGNFSAPAVEAIQRAKEAPSAGYVEERVTNTRTVPIGKAQRWWEQSKFEGTSEAKSQYIDPRERGDSSNDPEHTIAYAEHHALWKPDQRIGIEPGSLMSSRRESMVEPSEDDGRRESMMTAGFPGPFPRYSDSDAKDYVRDEMRSPYQKQMKHITEELHSHRGYGPQIY
jgi:hypothetical protein